MRTYKKMNKSVGSKVITTWYLFIAILIVLSLIPNMAATSDIRGNNALSLCEDPVKLPPVAVAQPEYQEGNIGDTIKFDGSGSYDPDGYIVSYEWDFGEGYFNCGETPEHIYWIPGDYTVTLIITDNDCLIDIDICIVIIIDPGTPPPCENQPPIAWIEPWYQTVVLSEEAYFDGSCSYDPDGTIISYEWDFGDGNYGVGEFSSHLYEVIGRYIVYLTVTDDDGATGCGLCYVEVTVNTPPPCENEPPVAIVDPKYQEKGVGETTNFDGSCSYDTDGTIVSYEWDFGDGATDSGMTTSHVYNVPGEYIVILTVTDDDGASSSDFCFVWVGCEPPPPPPPENEPPVSLPDPRYQEVAVGEEAIFNGSQSYDPDGHIVSYEWDFGDGTTGSGITTSHIYNVPAEYVVTLTVTDDDGASASDCVFVWVRCSPPPPPPGENQPPVPIPSPRTQEVAVGEEATFNGSLSFDPDGYIVSYEWDFGDNSSDSGILVTHAFDSSGFYYVMLTVTDNENASSFDYCIVRVIDNEPPPSENHPPVAIPEPRFQEVMVNESAFFDGSKSYDPDGHIVAYEWDFGDGTLGYEAVVEHSYDTMGFYWVSLMVTDNENATTVEFCTVMVVDERVPPPSENCPPIAFAMPKYQRIGPNETALLDGSGSVDLDGTIVSYEWDFGDGTLGSGEIVEHQYTEEGSYDVILTVTDDDNASSIDICYVYVCESNEPWPGDNLPPVPDCTPKTLEIFVGEYAKFHGTDSYDPDGYIISYKWDFGQGTIYNGVLVSHMMSQVGTFEVTFTVRDNLGAEASEVVTVTVLERSVYPPERPDPDLPDDGKVPIPDRDDDEEPLLILTAGLVNVATFKEGWERIVPVEVVAYHGYVRSVSIELIDDGGLEIDVIPIVRNVPEGKIVKFYLKIRVPEFEDDTLAQGITIKLKAVGEDCESNVEYVDILISSDDMQEDPEYSEAATTVGTISGATILGLLLKRRFL